MKVTLAHDSLTQFGGAERIATALHELYPQSEVYTLVTDKNLLLELRGWTIRNSWLQPLYNLYPHFQHLFPLIPFMLFIQEPIETDVMISSSSSFIKGIKVLSRTIHINYCHTPTRFLWVDPSHAEQEIAPLLRPLARIFLSWLKRWDYNKAQRVNYFIANSREVQARIKKYYGKDSIIIYPFIDETFWRPTQGKGDYFLIGGRLQRAKGLDVVIKVFNELQLPLHVVGTGRHESYLRSIAGPSIKFLGRLGDNELRDEYSGALGFIYPQFEDFGMMPLEAAACGTATIGLARGGSLETIVPGETGELLSEVDEQTLAGAVKSWQISKYDMSKLRDHALKFSKTNFKRQITEFVTKVTHENSH